MNDVEVSVWKLDEEFQPGGTCCWIAWINYENDFCTPNNPVGERDSFNVSGKWRLVLMGLSW